SSGADKDAKLTSKNTEKEVGFVEYLNNSDKWEKITAKKESDLKAGDILVSAVEGVGYNHTFIYLGNSEVAAANKGIHYGRIGSLENEWCTEWGGKTAFQCVDVPFQVYRIVDSNCEDKCTTYEGEYPQYNQCGESWSSYPYSSDNICGSGCGAASMAMLATVATGRDIYPDDIADLLGNQYYDSVSIATLDPIVGEHYGFDVEVVNTSGVEDVKTKMRDYLKKGYMIHFTGKGCYPGFIYASGGCTAGHVIGLFDIDDNDIVTQANSGMGEVHQKASLDDMANALNFNIFTAIKGGNNGKNSCDDDFCNNSSSNSSVSMDGLTEDQAQKVADYYNNEATASNFIDGVIPSSCAKVNCVSFSYWFVSAFTDASEEGVTSSIIGDGSYIADTGLPSVGWETGNDPTPYSIFGGAGSSAWSHTGVVVGETDDGNILTIEAAYCQWDARVMTRSPSYFSNGVGILAYPGDHFTPNESHLGNKSLKEIIGS
ncbi:MAG: hypothetical protein Q4C24_03100, partial [Candidatus Saccharibacteria bacterium]|nr:hypothetical protein [Candidatus Saccharibacteria bacterium]